jgi:hypothetical protein
MKECDWQQIEGQPGHFWCPECKRLYGGPKGQRREKLLCERLAMRVCVLPGEERETPRQLPPRIAALARAKHRPKRGPCEHRGDLLGYQECETCRGTTKIKLFACALHGQCTLGRKLEGIACCAPGQCGDYLAKIPIADPQASE